MLIIILVEEMIINIKYWLCFFRFLFFIMKNKVVKFSKIDDVIIKLNM